MFVGYIWFSGKDFLGFFDYFIGVETKIQVLVNHDVQVLDMFRPVNVYAVDC